MSYEILNSIYHIRIKFIDVFSLSGGCVSDLKQQLEAMRDRMAEEHFKKTGWAPTEGYVLNYQAGFNAAIPIILKAVEQKRSYIDKSLNSAYVDVDRSISYIEEKENQELLKQFVGSTEICGHPDYKLEGPGVRVCIKCGVFR